MAFTLEALLVNDFPREARDEFRAIQSETAAIESDEGEGSFAATINRTTEETACSYARRIFELSAKAERAIGVAKSESDRRRG